MSESEREHLDRLVTIAIIVSRSEALCLADMLNAEGIATYVGAGAHASVQVNSLALGGHRIWVPAIQLEQASDLIREVGLDRDWSFSHGLQKSVLRFLGVFVGLQAGVTTFAATIGALPWLAVLMTPLSILTVPVNPQGRGDYFLSEENSRS